MSFAGYIQMHDKGLPQSFPCGSPILFQEKLSYIGIVFIQEGFAGPGREVELTLMFAK